MTARVDAIHVAAHLTQPTSFLDYDHPDVVAYADRMAGHLQDPVAIAVALYYAIRDGFRYTPWGVSVQPAAFAASKVAGRSYSQGGHCIDKALLLAACARYRGIPARLHFANVRNHVGTAELERQLGTDLLVFHGYSELFLQGQWVAATPAFNRQLCERLGVAALEFDGHSDSIFQAYDRKAGRFMEYVDDHGSFDDLPFEEMVAAWRLHYPGFAATGRWPQPVPGPT
jgi:transglutaminase-like putative cysteine protease